jgi:hypothetical protein
MGIVADRRQNAVLEWFQWRIGGRQSTISRTEAIAYLQQRQRSHHRPEHESIAASATVALLAALAPLPDVRGVGFSAIAPKAFSPVLLVTFFIASTEEGSARSQFRQLSAAYGTFDESLHPLIATGVQYVEVDSRHAREALEKYSAKLSRAKDVHLLHTVELEPVTSRS